MDPLNISNVRSGMQVDQTANSFRSQNVPDDTRKAEKTGTQEEAGRQADRLQDKKSEASQADAAAVARSTYGDVLDISEDGDTVTARPEALKALDDGLVIFKGEQDEDKTSAQSTLEAEKEAAEAREEIRRKQEEAAEEAKEAREELRTKAEKAEEKQEDSGKDAAQNVSLNGYPDNMVDTLYKEGKIDQSEYNAEERRRDRLDDIRSGGSDDNSQDRIDRLAENAEELGQINAEAQNEALENEAFETAVENGRGDVYQNLFVEQTN